MLCFHITTFYDLDLTSGRGRVAQSRLFAVYFARLSEIKVTTEQSGTQVSMKGFYEVPGENGP